MADYYVNRKGSPQSIAAIGAMYEFATLGHYPANAELLPYVTEGKLMLEAAIPAGSVQATRRPTDSNAGSGGSSGVQSVSVVNGADSLVTLDVNYSGVIPASGAGDSDLSAIIATPCKHFRIWLDDGATPIRINFGGVATGTMSQWFSSMGVKLADFATARSDLHILGVNAVPAGNFNIWAGN